MTTDLDVSPHTKRREAKEPGKIPVWLKDELRRAADRFGRLAPHVQAAYRETLDGIGRAR